MKPEPKAGRQAPGGGEGTGPAPAARPTFVSRPIFAYAVASAVYAAIFTALATAYLL